MCQTKATTLQYVNMSVHLTSFQFLFVMFFFFIVCLLFFCNVIWRCAPIARKRKSKQVQISLDKHFFFFIFFFYFYFFIIIYLAWIRWCIWYMWRDPRLEWNKQAERKKKHPSHMKPIIVIDVFSVVFIAICTGRMCLFIYVLIEQYLMYLPKGIKKKWE